MSTNLNTESYTRLGNVSPEKRIDFLFSTMPVRRRDYLAKVKEIKKNIPDGNRVVLLISNPLQKEVGVLIDTHLKLGKGGAINSHMVSKKINHDEIAKHAVQFKNQCDTIVVLVSKDFSIDHENCRPFNGIANNISLY